MIKEAMMTNETLIILTSLIIGIIMGVATCYKNSECEHCGLNIDRNVEVERDIEMDRNNNNNNR